MIFFSYGGVFKEAMSSHAQCPQTHSTPAWPMTLEMSLPLTFAQDPETEDTSGQGSQGDGEARHRSIVRGNL